MSGVRSSKTVGSTTYKYDTLSGKVMRQTWGSNVADFVYDENNQPYAMLYDDPLSGEGIDTYYYMLNVQGDVVGLIDGVGNQIVQYNYDPWGKLLSIYTYGDTPGINNWYRSVAEANPLRYRGYCYDTETGFYYLQTRYYDPAIGRFINADTYTTTDAEGLLSTNMFAYCENNPVMGSDPTGEWVHLAIGAAIGAAVNVATSYINHKIAGEKYTLKEAAIDVVSGAASGALAASGVGLLGQVVGNGAISEITYLARCDATKTKITISGMKQSLAIGIISGFIGGKGVDGKRLIGAYNTTKQNLKTAVSPKKISLYKGRISRYKTDAAKGTARFVLANIFSNSYDNVRKQLFS